ncbi:penicillin-binding protein activator [Gilvimarinus sp. F26214L]|uniref:penicillin-binding protein activator n=1 Tax=Gilvimarinus sp. DZF01 TaxID=3461371 RepID=UPI00404671B6
MLSFARPFLLIALCSGLLILSGCSGQPRPRGDVQVDAVTSERVRDLLAQAQTSDSPERDRRQLEAARLLVEIGEFQWAMDLLGSIDPDLLVAGEFVNYTLDYSRAARELGDYFLAQRILTNPRVEQQWDALSTEAARELRASRAELFALLGEHVASVQERVVLGPLLETEEEHMANQDGIWQSLMALSEAELAALDSNPEITRSPVLRGWAELAVLSKNNAADIERQESLIDDWIARRPEHPASQRLPSDLQLLKQLVEEQPRQVALLLPLNGDYERAGKAVRDGFLAAYYHAKDQNSYVPQIRIFDTNSDDFNAVYDLAVQDGAELIVGPLRPEYLDELHLRPNLPVPTLALNYAANPFGLPDQLYQFSFEVEDEARQVAARAWLEGHRYALVLVPQTERGERSARAFREAWTELGGTIVNQSYYADPRDYSGVVESALLVDESKARARALRQRLGGSLRFETPRRRQDVDFVFMAADAAAGQLLKPTLAFHYAGGLPVYSTSSIFAADEGLRTSRDLNGIRFITLPWHFDNSSSVKSAVERYADPAPSYLRLYAMGVDAYRLYPRLKQLERVQGTRFYGQTGVLALTPERKVQREQVWAQIISGRAEPLPTVVTEADDS